MAFLLCLAAPLAATLLMGSSAGGTGEADGPWRGHGLNAVLGFPLRYRRYFSDHFGFREKLIKLHGRLKVHCLGISSSSQVILGRNGWLYYSGENGHEVDDCRGLGLLQSQELAEWRERMLARRDRLAKLGIPFYVLLVPNKSTVYRENVPAWMTQVNQQSRLDQFLACLDTCPGVRVLDMRPPLLAAKAQWQVYYKTDTHWNVLGAFIAYQHLAQGLRASFPGLQVECLQDFKISSTNQPGGDLARLLGLQEDMREPAVWLTPLQGRQAQPVGKAAEESGRDVHYAQSLITVCPGAEIPRAMIFRDSFGDALIPFLSEHIGRAVYVWTTTFDFELIEKEKPSVVIFEVVERGLRWGIPRQ